MCVNSLWLDRAEVLGSYNFLPAIKITHITQLSRDMEVNEQFYLVYEFDRAVYLLRTWDDKFGILREAVRHILKSRMLLNLIDNIGQQKLYFYT